MWYELVIVPLTDEVLGCYTQVHSTYIYIVKYVFTFYHFPISRWCSELISFCINFIYIYINIYIKLFNMIQPQECLKFVGTSELTKDIHNSASQAIASYRVFLWLCWRKETARYGEWTVTDSGHSQSWPGNASKQDIYSFDIDNVFPEYTGLNTRKMNSMLFDCSGKPNVFFFDLTECARVGPAIISSGCPTPQVSCWQ